MRQRSIVFYLLALPAVIGFAFYSVIPAALGVSYSFTRYDGFNPAEYIGFNNFIDLFNDSGIYEAYAFTFRYAIVGTLLVNVVSLAVALGLNANIRFKTFLRGVFFVPNVLSLLIIGYIFGYFFSMVLPAIGEKLGIPFLSTNILIDFSSAWLGIVLVGVWQASGLTIIMYLAGLQSVPQHLYEAAVIDGANRWQSFRFLTLPLIAPFLTINIVLTTRSFLGVFDQIISLTGGGPGNATKSVIVMIYRDGFGGSQFGYQSANALIFSLVMLAIALIQLVFLRKREVDM